MRISDWRSDVCSSDLLESFGIAAIAAHVRALAERLIGGLHELGVEVLTPAGPDRHAGNVCFRCPDPEAVMRRAAEEAILIWADNGRVRLSAHLFTSEIGRASWRERGGQYV